MVLPIGLANDRQKKGLPAGGPFNRSCGEGCGYTRPIGGEASTVAIPSRYGTKRLVRYRNFFAIAADDGRSRNLVAIFIFFPKGEPIIVACQIQFEPARQRGSRATSGDGDLLDNRAYSGTHGGRNLREGINLLLRPLPGSRAPGGRHSMLAAPERTVMLARIGGGRDDKSR